MGLQSGTEIMIICTQVGAGSLDEDVVPGEAAGRKEHSAWANIPETNGETVETGPVKDTESSPSAEKQGL